MRDAPEEREAYRYDLRELIANLIMLFDVFAKERIAKLSTSTAVNHLLGTLIEIMPSLPDTRYFDTTRFATNFVMDTKLMRHDNQRLSGLLQRDLTLLTCST